MPSADKNTTPIALDSDQYEFRYADLDGYTVGFETFKVDADPAPLFAGLPDDRCQCPHWGYVVAGKVTYRYADHDETFVAGDAYYGAPGHLPLVTAGTQVIEFSPTPELAKTQEVIGRNMAAGIEV
jgi:hypothetical protein